MSVDKRIVSFFYHVLAVLVVVDVVALVVVLVLVGVVVIILVAVVVVVSFVVVVVLHLPCLVEGVHKLFVLFL